MLEKKGVRTNEKNKKKHCISVKGVNYGTLLNSKEPKMCSTQILKNNLMDNIKMYKTYKTY